MTNQSSSVFSILDDDTAVKVEKMDAASREAEDRLNSLSGLVDSESYSAAIDEAESRLEKAVTGKNMTDEEASAIRKKIMESTLKSVRDETASQEKDLQTAVYGLNGVLNQIGEGYANLGKESPEDLALVEKAENRLERASKNLRNAETEMAVAKSKTKLLWIRSRAVNEANAKLVECQTETANAKEGVPAAKAEAARNARERLKNANMEEALGALNSRSENVLGIMKKSRTNGKSTLTVVSARKELAFKTQEQATVELEKLTEQLNGLEVEIQEAEDSLTMMESGSSEYTAKQGEITNLRKQMEETRSAKNGALVLANSKAEYARELELDEKVLQRLVGNLEGWILQLSSATAERKVTFQARLQGEKLLSDQDAAKQIDEVGSQVDSQNRSRMAEMAVGADNALQDMMSSLPGRRKELANVEMALAQHNSKVREKDAKFLDDFMNEYGIDPLSRSEFNRAESVLDETEAEAIS